MNTLSFDAKIHKCYQVLSNILSIMSLRSMIQTVSLCQKKLFKSLWHGLLTCVDLDKVILFIFRFHRSFHIKTLTFWYQHC